MEIFSPWAYGCRVVWQRAAVELRNHKLEVLRGHCDDAGTDYDAIQKTVIGQLDPVSDRDGFLTAMGEYAALGIDLVTLVPMAEDPVAWTTTVVDEHPMILISGPQIADLPLSFNNFRD